MKRSVSMTVLITLDLDDEDYTGVENAQDILGSIERMFPEAEVKAIEIDVSAAHQTPN